MNLTIPFSNEWFQADHNSQVSAALSGGFRLNTTPEGGEWSFYRAVWTVLYGRNTSL